ncbi:hypothetical protein [Dactylosporangium sp. NPDC050588]|uniref:hypothetical protein n=1 Tax=Dactylosporangium sp. NPDC050588 TaxID=3157211 RepID=UPI0033F40D93
MLVETSKASKGFLVENVNVQLSLSPWACVAVAGIVVGGGVLVLLRSKSEDRAAIAEALVKALHPRPARLIAAEE